MKKDMTDPKITPFEACRQALQSGDLLAFIAGTQVSGDLARRCPLNLLFFAL